jgi:outer membrane protein assembly factor BamB
MIPVTILNGSRKRNPMRPNRRPQTACRTTIPQAWQILIGLLASQAALVSYVAAADWPQWLGAARDSIWREDGIVERFGKESPRVLWRVPVELGYAGPAVAKGRAYVADYQKRAGEVKNNPGGRDELQGAERLLCFESRTGELIWKDQYDQDYKVSYPSGPRCTPLVDGVRVYTLGAEGMLRCLNTADGQLIWSRKLTDDYKTETPQWGFAAHPLVDGNHLYCVVGGENSVAVALDKRTGREVWKALSADEPGYCPPTIIEHGGLRQLLIWHPKSINSLDPQTGEVFWSVPLEPDFGMSIAAPRQLGALIFASGVKSSGALLRLADDRPAAEVLWRGNPKTAVYSANSTPFVEDGVIYGCDGQSGALIAARLEDGQRLWRTTDPTCGTRRGSYGTAFLVKHQDRFFLFSETGDLILARLSREGYEELDRFHVLEPTGEAMGRDVVWSHPAFAERCLFARNDRELVCVSLAANP